MLRSRCWGAPLAVLVVSLSFAPGPSTSLAAAAPRAAATPPGCYGGELFDFNDDGHTDVAVGEPHGQAGKVHDAGSVEVRYGCGALAPQQLQLKHPHRGDRFGAALDQGYYDDGDDSYRVLFVGVPHLDVDGHDNAGGVAEFHSSSKGLTLDRVLTQASRGVPGKVQGGAHFGAALSLSDDDEDAFTLRIGEPGKNVGHAKDTGGYVSLHWDDDPEQEDPGATETTIADFGVKAQDGDLFGSSFFEGDGTHRVGAPGRSVDGHHGAGAVLENTDPQLVDQDTAGVPGDPGTNDHFGAALGGSWIGVPGETVGTAARAGVVQYWEPSNPGSASTVSQDTAGIPGAAGSDHEFGAALAYNAGFRFSGGPDQDDLLVGAPGDRSGTGSVTLLRIPGDAVIGSATSFPGAAVPGGHFGTTVSTSGNDRVLVGAPDADGGRVFSYRLSPDPAGAPVLGTSWTRDPSAPAAGTDYGATLAGPFADE